MVESGIELVVASREVVDAENVYISSDKRIKILSSNIKIQTTYLSFIFTQE